jgi:hypothetical protein
MAKYQTRDGSIIDSADIGWQVLDPEGNVVDCGPMSEAHLTAEAIQKYGLTPVEDDITS